MRWLQSGKASLAAKAAVPRFSRKGACFEAPSCECEEQERKAPPAASQGSTSGGAEIIDLASYMKRRGSGEDNETHILVVGKERGFSDALTEYALRMAGRIECNIAALNVVSAGQSLLAAIDEELKQSLATAAAEHASDLERKAAQMNIGFRHELRFGDPEMIVEQMYGELLDIVLVMTEPEDNSKSVSAGRVPVFCLTTH